MKTKIKDYLRLIIPFSIGIAVFLLIRPFLQPLLNKLIALMTSSHAGLILTIIIGVGTIELGCILLYAILAFMVKEIKGV